MQAPTQRRDHLGRHRISGYGPINLDFSIANGYVWSTLIHEVGHIVGLGHGGPYNFTVNTEQQQFGAYDSLQWAIMSYVNPDDPSTRFYGDYASYVQWTDLGRDALGTHYNPLSPQMLDILAAQRLYGASTNATFDGGNTYGFNSTFTDDYFKQVYDFNDGRNPWPRHHVVGALGTGCRKSRPTAPGRSSPASGARCRPRRRRRRRCS